MNKRTSGIVLHITSLPGEYGTGTMGKEARDFVDFMAKSAQKYWQILPLNPVGLGNSPYMSTSVFAGNTLLIDLPDLVEQGLLTQEEIDTARSPSKDWVDWDMVHRTRPTLLDLAWRRATPELLTQVQDFSDNNSWVPDYCFFMALREHFHGVPLTQWPDRDILLRKPAAMAHYQALLADRIAYYAFGQYLFFTQWGRLHRYANERGVKIIGDLPMYVSGDSSDVWANPELFLLDESLLPTYVAGVPADAFTADGQRWGNPLYNWEVHQADGFAWWCRRVDHSMSFYDVLRFDHFRGFDTYWAIEANCSSALVGQWRKGPGMALINRLKQQVPNGDYIAEDLGLLSESAYQLVKDSGFPGMRVLVDAFDPSGSSSFLPHCCPIHAVMYTSTHDTATFVQWLAETSTQEERTFATKYLRLRPDEGLGWGAVCGVWASHCMLAMTTMQDILGLGGDARMNTPGTAGKHNWAWRVRMEALNDTVADQLRDITHTYGRMPS